MRKKISLDANVRVKIDSIWLNVQFVTEDIVRISKGFSDSLPELPAWIYDRRSNVEQWECRKENDSIIKCKSSKIELLIDLTDGSIIWKDIHGQIRLNALNNSQSGLFSSDTATQDYYSCVQQFLIPEKEGLYGLGQFQDGDMNYRGKSLILVQDNVIAVNPFLVSSGGLGILWNNASRSKFVDTGFVSTFTSETAIAIDFFVICRSGMDEAIAGYRELTGTVPMLPKAALGFWQSKNRYKSQDEILEIAKKHRELGIPIDVIVQDYYYWSPEKNVEDDLKYWNSTQFFPERYPDVRAMTDILRKELNIRFSTVIWPSVGSESEIYRELDQAGHLFPVVTYPLKHVRLYDAFSSEAREIYWKYIAKNLFSKGVDFWWMDATEPEFNSPINEVLKIKTAMGPFAKHYNAYSFFTTKGIYEHQRATTDQKRVCILTRSGFTGQQRFSTIVWSGDVYCNWENFRKQIAAGINFCISGIPYWTTDIGGYYAGKDYPLGIDDPGFVELYVRWFQFGAFCPVFRSHGTTTPREAWLIAEKEPWAWEPLIKFNKLRYRLLPYIYSLSHKVTDSHYSIMRGLVMDFPQDEKAGFIGNEFMFGPSFLVCPVTRPIITHKGNNPEIPAIRITPVSDTSMVYLPKNSGWYDFYTGKYYNGGQEIAKSSPIGIMPLYIKAGSIIPVGPNMSYSDEYRADTMNILIYTGDNAVFDLYEDENDNYNYENGVFAKIAFNWNNTEKKLIIGRREGSFPKMPKVRLFRIYNIDSGQQNSFDDPGTDVKEILYNGSELIIEF